MPGCKGRGGRLQCPQLCRDKPIPQKGERLEPYVGSQRDGNGVGNTPWG
jgi:hypothetical protein